MIDFKKIRGYCNYCKDKILRGKPYTKDSHGHIYCPDCFIQMNTYTDDFGNYNTNEFGDPIE